jgi:hypothetical protein
MVKTKRRWLPAVLILVGLLLGSIGQELRPSTFGEILRAAGMALTAAAVVWFTWRR